MGTSMKGLKVTITNDSRWHLCCSSHGEASVGVVAGRGTGGAESGLPFHARIIWSLSLSSYVTYSDNMHVLVNSCKLVKKTIISVIYTQKAAFLAHMPVC